MALTFTPRPTEKEVCPDFSLKNMTGQIRSKKDFFKGAPVLVMFICNHCPYVMAIEDRLVELGHDLRRLEIPVVAICSNDPTDHPEDSLSNLQKRAQEKKYPFEYLHDAEQTVAQSFGAVCTPDFFLFDREGHLKYRGRLDDSWKDASKVTKRELFTAAQDLQSHREISFSEKPSMGCSIKWKS